MSYPLPFLYRAQGGAGAPAFAPSDVAGLVQWLHTPGGYGAPWFKDQSQTGDDRILGGGPGLQRGQCLTLNGTNQYFTHAEQTMDGDFTLSAWCKLSTLGMLWTKPTVNNNYIWFLGSTTLRCQFNGTNADISHGHTFSTGVWFHIAVVRSGSTITVYKDGVAGGTTGTNGATWYMSGFGRYSGGFASAGDVFDVRTYDAALSADNITWLANHGASGTDPGISDLLYWYKTDEQSGTTLYDSNANTLAGTLVNSPVYGTQDRYSFQNSVGYYLSGSVFVPRDEADTANDVLGNTLAYSGSAPRHGKVVDNNALQFNGTNQYLSLTTDSTTVKTIAVRFKADNIASHTGCLVDLNGTDYLTIVNGTITVNGFSAATTTIYVDGAVSSTIGDTTGWHTVVVTSDTGFTISTLYAAALTGASNFLDGALCDLRLSTTEWSSASVDQYHGLDGEPDTAHWYPIAEGVAGATYEVDHYSAALGLAFNSPTVIDQDVFAYNANYGWTKSGSTYIPALADGTADAVNGTIGTPAGAWLHDTGEFNLDFDPFTIPALATGNLASYDMEDAYGSVYRLKIDDLHASDQHFALRTSAAINSEFILYAADLSGDDWDNIHIYCQSKSQVNDRMVSAWTMNSLTAGTPKTVEDVVGSSDLDDSDDIVLSPVSGKLGNALHAAMTGGSYTDTTMLDVATAPLALDVAGTHFGWIKEAVQDTGGNDATILQQNTQHKLEILNANGFLKWTFNGSTLTGDIDCGTGNGWHFYMVARDEDGNLTLWTDAQHQGVVVGATLPSVTGLLKHFEDDGYDWEGHYDESGVAGTNKLRDNHYSYLRNLGSGRAIGAGSYA